MLFSPLLFSLMKKRQVEKKKHKRLTVSYRLGGGVGEQENFVHVKIKFKAL